MQRPHRTALTRLAPALTGPLLLAVLALPAVTSTVTTTVAVSAAAETVVGPVSDPIYGPVAPAVVGPLAAADATATPASAPVVSPSPAPSASPAPAQPASTAAPDSTAPAAVTGTSTPLAATAPTVVSTTSTGTGGRPLWLRRSRLVAPVAASAPPVNASLTGGAPLGDLPGWRQTFLDDFTTPVPLGGFLTSPVYKARYAGYDGPDTSGVGTYSPARVLSVKDGALDLYLHTENGRPLGAAVVPLYDGRWGGQTYGRFSIRFRSDPLHGYGLAGLLWPNSDVWNEGEIDFPEGDLDGDFWAHNHCVGDPQRSCWSKDTQARFTAWHVATVEWLPGQVSFFLDGALLGTSHQAPSTAMHLVLQACTNGYLPAASTAGHLQIDWIAIWARA